jgi:hypothetical protein
MGASDLCLKALDASSSAKVIQGSAFALQLMHKPAVVDVLILKLNQSKDTRVRQAAIRALARLYFDEKPFDGTWWSTRSNTKAPYYQTVGEQLEGFVMRDSAEDIEIRNLAGVPAVIRRSDIDESGRRETSMMPERLVDGLSVEDLASLVAYLESLRKE